MIQTEEQLKLIDLGGVRAIDGDGADLRDGRLPGARRSRPTGPSPSSDLYTVGRTLAVLTFDFAGYQGEYKYRLPDDEPLLAEQESFARLLRRATHPDPARRFQSAGEMAEQLTGVLREVLAVADGEPRPAFSGLFSPELRAVGAELTAPAGADAGALAAPPPAAEVIAGLPVPLADSADPAAGYLATLAGLPPEQQAAALPGRRGRRRRRYPPAVTASAETRLALVRALIAAGDWPARPRTWPSWPRPTRPTGGSPGTRACASSPRDGPTGPGRRSAPSTTSSPASSRPSSRSASRPRRRATRRPRGTTTSLSGRSTGPASAPRSARPGPAWPTATGPAAIAAVAAVPQTSSYHAAAQIAAIRLLVAPAAPGLRRPTCARPTRRLGVLSLDDADPAPGAAHGGDPAGGARLGVDRAQPPAARRRPGGERILGCEPNERALRFGLERGYRALASLSPDPARRNELVDLANSVRPRTWT